MDFEGIRPVPLTFANEQDCRVQLQGSICALATPFDEGGQLDLAGFSRLIEHQLAGGTRALVVAGSTGEAHMLAESDHVRLLQHAVGQVEGRVPVIAGCGSAATDATINGCRRAAHLGADAVLVVTPYYVRPDQRCLENHFRTVADAVELPILLYNVPARTGCDLQPATVAALRDHPRIVGIKEAVPDPQRISALSNLAADDFVFLSGDDGSAMEAMLAGASGTVSVIANAVPRMFGALCDAALAGDRALAGQTLDRLSPLLDALACAPNPIPIKAALAALDICSEQVRLPLLPLPQGDERARLRQLVLEMQD